MIKMRASIIPLFHHAQLLTRQEFDTHSCEPILTDAAAHSELAFHIDAAHSCTQ